MVRVLFVTSVTARRENVVGGLQTNSAGPLK